MAVETKTSNSKAKVTLNNDTERDMMVESVVFSKDEWAIREKRALLYCIHDYQRGASIVSEKKKLYTSDLLHQ